MSRYTNTDNNNTSSSPYSNSILSTIATVLVTFTKKRKNRLPYVFYGSIGFIIIIYCLYYLSLTSSLSSSSKDLDQTKSNQVHVDYMDTSQLMNSQELQRLLFQDNTSPWSVIPEHRKYGHSEQQLQTLLDTASATPATITALLHAAPTATFYTQLAAVLHQSSPPSTVWLVCDSTHDQTALQRHIQALPVEKTTTVHVLLSQHTTSKKKDDDAAAWMLFALQADSDYIWILEKDSVPGEGYLERLVRLSSTPAYKHTLLGTLGYDEQDQCIESTDADFVTRPAHRLGGGLWFLHRSWLALDLFRPLVSQDRGRVVSSYLNHIGVTPIVLPLSHPSQSHDATQATPLAACSSLPSTPPPTTTATPSLAFLVDQAEQFQELMPLICHRRGTALDTPIIHVLSTQVSSLSTLQAMLFEHDPKCLASSTLVLHPLSDWLLTYPQHEQQAWQLAQTLLHQLPLTMARLNATVLIHTLRSTHPLYYSLSQQHPSITTIRLPARDIQHVQWIMDLPMVALENWHTGKIQLVVTTDRNPYGLTRLLRSATKAHYMGDAVDLTVIMDQSSDRVTQRFVNDFNWQVGEKHLRHRIVKMNRMPLFVESWYPQDSDHDYAILLNDDLDLSPLYYLWVKQAVLKYRYSGHEDDGGGMVMGVSLYSPRVMDNDPSGRKLFTPSTDKAFLMQTMTNGGTLLFPEHWREFHDYVTARYADIRKKQLQTIDVPLARSAAWTHSWRKYMDELMYLRGYGVLFPPHQHSYSTQYLDLPHHTPAAAKDDEEAIRALFQVRLEHRQAASLPADLSTLPWFDLWGQPVTSNTELVLRGRRFQPQVSACPPPPQLLYDPADLLCPFARIVDVPVDQVSADVLPTRIATLYVTEKPTPM